MRSLQSNRKTWNWKKKNRKKIINFQIMNGCHGNCIEKPCKPKLNGCLFFSLYNSIMVQLATISVFKLIVFHLHASISFWLNLICSQNLYTVIKRLNWSKICKKNIQFFQYLLIPLLFVSFPNYMHFIVAPVFLEKGCALTRLTFQKSILNRLLPSLYFQNRVQLIIDTFNVHNDLL